MKVENNKVVSLIYELHEGSLEGKLIETVEENRPLKFIFGSGNLLQSFEKELSTLSSGDSFSFSLSAADAYGDRREELIMDVPISVFKTDGDKIDENICQIGNEVPMVDREGNRINGVINEIGDTYVKMDFNHPMAGSDLFFTGKVLEVRDATEEDYHKHSSSCSGCSGDHSDSCSGTCS
jgi:FKBP-type peptidyl-prolyl cis-trans isomerase SlyD